MKESVKITVIAAGFREVAGKKAHTRPSYLPKTWKAGREQQPRNVNPSLRRTDSADERRRSRWRATSAR